MPRVVPHARPGAEGGAGRPVGASTWKPESIKALQAALEANRAHHRKVEALQYELDEQERTLSDDVRKKMAALREAVNARERELLADAQLQHGARQTAVDDALHTCEQAWRALTQLQSAMSSDAGHSADDEEFLLEFNTKLSLLSHIPDVPSVDMALHLPVEDTLSTVQQLSFVSGDDAVHLAWKERIGANVGSRQAELRLKELAAQLQMVSADNARREDDILSANKRIRQMEEAAAAHSAEELRLQVLVERQRKQVSELQKTAEVLTLEMKEKEIQHRQDILEMQDLSTEKEQLLMKLMQESEEDHRIVLTKHDETKEIVQHLKQTHQRQVLEERQRVAHANKMAEEARKRALELTNELNMEAQRTEDVIKRWMEDLQRVGEVCERVGQTVQPVTNFLHKVCFCMDRPAVRASHVSKRVIRNHIYHI
jgi:hypothetical protein